MTPSRPVPPDRDLASDEQIERPPDAEDVAEQKRADAAADPRPEPGVAPEGRHPAAHHLHERDED
jgi:hypothetical protein